MIRSKIYKLFFSWKNISALFISVFFISLSLKDLNINDLDWNVISEINYFYISYTFFLFIVAIYFRAKRWSLTFNNKKDIKLLFHMQLIGYFGNNIFPLRLGEFLRSYLLSNKIKESNSYIFGTIVIERFLDMFMAAIFGLILLFYNASTSDYSMQILIIFIVVFLGLLISFFMKNNNKFDIPYLKFFNDIFKGFSQINSSNIILIFIYSLIIWMIYLQNIYFVQYAFNLNFTYLECMLILVVSTIFFALPTVPGSFGAFEYGVIFSIESILLKTAGPFLAFSLVLHLCSYIPYTLLGSIYFFKYYTFDKTFEDDKLE